MKKEIALIILALTLSGCATTGLSLSGDLDLAAKGDASGLNNMGSRYQFGDGVSKNYNKAVMYYQKAVDKGLPLAKSNLGYMYDLGLGVAENDDKAISLYEEAANDGSPNGMVNLAIMYAAGDNIEQSFEKAYFWLEIARFYTQRESNMQIKWRARGLRDQVITRLTTEQIKSINKMAHDWIEENR